MPIDSPLSALLGFAAWCNRNFVVLRVRSTVKNGVRARLRDGWTTTSHWVVKSNRWSKFVFQAFVYLVAPAYLIGRGSIDGAPFNTTLAGKLPTWAVPYAMLAGLWLWVATWQYIYNRMRSTVARRRLSFEDWAAINDLIGQAVKAKRNRISHYIADHWNNGNLPENALFEVTKPQEQFDTISTAIEKAFQAILSNIHGDSDISVKCRIVELDDRGRPCEFVAIGTQTTSTSIDDLANSSARTTFEISARQRKPIIIEDIAEELLRDEPRFAPVAGSQREGSLCCYPLIYEPNRNVPYAICVSSEDVNVFQEQDERVHGWLFGEFAERLYIEHGLLLICQETNGR